MMQDHFQKFGKLGLIFAMAILPVITADEGNGIDLDELSERTDLDEFEFFISENSRSKFNKRLRDVIVDMVQLGYIE